MKRFLLTDKQETCYTIATGILTQYLLGEKRKYDSKGNGDMTDLRRNVYFFTNKTTKQKNKSAL